MALFGAPIALEDHAFRACLAALDIQKRDATPGRRDSAPRRCRAAAAGRAEFGSGDRRRDRFGHLGLHRDRRASRDGPADGIGRPAGRGDAQRVHRPAGRRRRACSVSPSWCTSRAPTTPVPARRLLGIGDHAAADGAASQPWSGAAGKSAPSPRSSMRPIGGAGCVVNVVGPPGIGKSRLVREVAAIAAGRGVRGVHHLLRVPRQRHPVPRGGAVVAGGTRGERSRRPGGPGAAPRPGPRRRPRGSAVAR